LYKLNYVFFLHCFDILNAFLLCILPLNYNTTTYQLPVKVMEVLYNNKSSYFA